ncbi:hypothetical protein ZEAMMB73_Zm00001d013155 [Zea mays]|uniref:Uncharacterized protein n=1 Tax=Zea mays TaxID=4577 RepID=A0A1D6GG95_MAIZE|nr:hypothetical protein ZEAMMB73_Zm00001d013155 [Zea mays]
MASFPPPFLLPQASGASALPPHVATPRNFLPMAPFFPSMPSIRHNGEGDVLLQHAVTPATSSTPASGRRRASRLARLTKCRAMWTTHASSPDSFRLIDL